MAMSASPEKTLKSSTARVCVIGGGIIGSWTALHRAEAGTQVTLIEQFPLPHTRGSSHGLSRAFRFLGELELGRLDYSLTRWSGLQEAIGETLFIKTGLLNFGPPGDPELERYMNVLRDSRRPVQWLENEAIAKRFPMLNYSEDWGAAFDPNGGILVAHRCLNAVQSRFLELGGRIVTGCVKSFESQDARGIAIEMRPHNSDIIDIQSFDCAVICAGPWTAKLVPRLETHLNGNPVIDRLDNNTVIGCGFSGSGFKHSPATGLMLAALALGQDEAIPIEIALKICLPPSYHPSGGFPRYCGSSNQLVSKPGWAALMNISR